MRTRTTPRKRSLRLLWTFLLAAGCLTTTTCAFAPQATVAATTGRLRNPWVLSAKKSSSNDLPDIAGMKLKDIRQELESYGISTKPFLEKPEFVEALQKARAEGKQPKAQKANGKAGKTRSERMQEEMAKAKSMSVADLRKELTSRGIKTNAFFEKSEFVKAYAEAIVDGVKQKSGGSSSGAGRRSQQQEYDPSYRDVQMQKLDENARRMLSGTVIDIPTD